MAWLVSRGEVARAMVPATMPGSCVAQVRASCPPSDPPTTARSRRMPRCSTSSFWTLDHVADGDDGEIGRRRACPFPG